MSSYHGPAKSNMISAAGQYCYNEGDMVSAKGDLNFEEILWYITRL